MEAAPDLPVPLSLIGGRYLLFSIDTVTYLRREHQICGVFVGSIPQAPQQNVFLGLPLELMPEEARLLVEEGLAYLVDDGMAHRRGLLNASIQQRRRYLAELRSQGWEAANSQAGAKEQSRAKALSKARSKAVKVSSANCAGGSDNDHLNDTSESADTQSLFASPSPSNAPPSTLPPVSTLGVTPATSASLLTPPPPPPSRLEDERPAVPDSFPLFKHLHSKGYFVSPGLRFGCQYMVYPGDPLRFHSHFLASHVGWEEELDLMDIVRGGRLGTGVKKGYLIGGHEKKHPEDQEDTNGGAGNVRTFSIEWAGM
jgi:tRNA-splicing endonuclease subunit Sen34